MKADTEKFFETLGEIWRDITAIEFLMRCALAQKNGDINKLPKPPYKKGNSYTEYPASFSPKYFSELVDIFNKKFPELTDIPTELIELRNAMAHGIISQINHSGVDELIKFKKSKKSELIVEFSMTLELKKIQQIQQSLKELRRHIGKVASDK